MAISLNCSFTKELHIPSLQTSLWHWRKVFHRRDPSLRMQPCGREKCTGHVLLCEQNQAGSEDFSQVPRSGPWSAEQLRQRLNFYCIGLSFISCSKGVRDKVYLPVSVIFCIEGDLIANSCWNFLQRPMKRTSQWRALTKTANSEYLLFLSTLNSHG